MAYLGFKKLENKIASRGNVRNPGAVAAKIGREKYGASKMAHAAATGTSLKGAKTQS